MKGIENSEGTYGYEDAASPDTPDVAVEALVALYNIWLLEVTKDQFSYESDSVFDRMDDLRIIPVPLTGDKRTAHCAVITDARYAPLIVFPDSGDPGRIDVALVDTEGGKMLQRSVNLSYLPDTHDSVFRSGKNSVAKGARSVSFNRPNVWGSAIEATGTLLIPFPFAFRTPKYFDLRVQYVGALRVTDIPPADQLRRLMQSDPA
ncbi:hypothetical protein A2Z33_01850 [Candidatus Gottesmanbacteria bacterium RBG_16_52_11]|uniref:Uncharacterized protein n=1 Tax=Candidatus Gottesmanbacteria bacterium RBG_16_52_11 TaxID=1798374 RepID=A0A1F5YQQ0_9BACT|nr:MAG: hypothetical protein A2Z33_01850 [Candidatus Gottesmanbacteria bacterium RBG_16_52_11]